MKKKLTLILLVFVCALCCSFALAACDNSDNSDNNVDQPNIDHTHTWKWKYDDYSHWKHCEACDERTEPIEHDFSNEKCVCGKITPASDKHQHKYSDDWASDETSHWHICISTEGVCDTPKRDIATHDFSNGACVCGKVMHKQFAEQDWKEALSLSAFTNFTTTADASDYKLLIKCDLDAKKYYYTVNSGNTFYYAKKSDSDTYFEYRKLDIGTDFVKTEITEEKYNDGLLCLEPLLVLQLVDSYSLFDYNEENNSYVSEKAVVDDNVCHVELKFDNGRLSYAIIAIGNAKLMMRYSDYDNTEVVLPTNIHSHVWSWGINRKTHTRVCTQCGITEEMKHDFSEGNCSCGFSSGECYLNIVTVYATDRTYTAVRGLADWCKDEELPTIVIPEKTINDNTVTVIEASAFANCDNLKEIVIPDTVTSIGYNAFDYCLSLTNVTMGNGIADIAAGAFQGCYKLQYNEHDNALYLGNASNNFVALIKAKDTNITSCTIHSDTKCVGSRAFEYCNDLTSIAIPSSVTSIGHDVFLNCDKLQYNEHDNALYLGNADNNYLALIKAKNRNVASCAIHRDTKFIYDGSFSNCSSLTNIIIPDNVMSIGSDAFSNCSSLKNVAIPDSVTSVGSYAFSNCTSLNTLTMPARFFDSFDKSTLKSVTFTDMANCNNISFDGCDNLEIIIFPEGYDTTHLSFDSCPKYKGTLVGDLFLLGDKLKGVKEGVIALILPPNVKTIAANAFADTLVKYLYIPTTVTTVETGAFTASLLEGVFYEGNAKIFLQGKTYANIGSCTADGWIYTESDSSVSVRAYIGVGGEVNVPAQINGKAVTVLSQEGGIGNVFLGRSDITKITFMSLQIDIEAGTMANLANLEEIAFSANTGAISMSKAAYEGCANLVRISLIGGYENYQLTEVTFSVGGEMPSTTTVNITDAEGLLTQLNEADANTVCMIALKQQTE